MVQPVCIEDIKLRPAGAGLGIPAGVDKTTDTAQNCRAYTHDTGLKRDVQGRGIKSPVHQVPSGIPQRHYFRMGGGIHQRLTLVAAASHNDLIGHNHGADRDIRRAQCQVRFTQRDVEAFLDRSRSDGAVSA